MSSYHPASKNSMHSLLLIWIVLDLFLKNKMNRDVGLISTKGQLQSSSEHFPVSSMCMPWQVKKSRRPADYIPEMFMPRKAFDNELRHERLICREAKVICCCLPPPRLMSQEPRCQMHRGITFH